MAKCHSLYVRLLASMLACAHAAPSWDDMNTEFMQKIAEAPGIVARPSGLHYRVVESGPLDGKLARENQTCTVVWTGKLVNGKVFHSTYGKPASFRPDQVVDGLKEAMTLMRPGDKWDIFVPAELVRPRMIAFIFYYRHDLS